MAVMLMSSDFDKIVTDFFKNYHDRGMKKWGGFFLSDHTLKINQDQKKRDEVFPKRKTMTEEEVSTKLFQAFSNHYYVEIQLKELDNEGKYKADICGFVEGYIDKQIIVSGQRIILDDINNIIVKK